MDKTLLPWTPSLVGRRTGNNGNKDTDELLHSGGDGSHESKRWKMRTRWGIPILDHMAFQLRSVR